MNHPQLFRRKEPFRHSPAAAPRPQGPETEFRRKGIAAAPVGDRKEFRQDLIQDPVTTLAESGISLLILQPEQLVLHQVISGFPVKGEIDVVRENKAEDRGNLPKRKVIFHGTAHPAEKGADTIGHGDQVPRVGESDAADPGGPQPAAGLSVFFQDPDTEPFRGKTDPHRQTADSCPDHQHTVILHSHSTGTKKGSRAAFLSCSMVINGSGDRRNHNHSRSLHRCPHRRLRSLQP